MWLLFYNTRTYFLITRPLDAPLLRDLSDSARKDALDIRCHDNVDTTGQPFHHRAADGTIVEPDPTVEYLLSRLPLDDRDFVKQHWEQFIKPDALPAVPVDLDWYEKYPITRDDLEGRSGRFK